MRHHLLLLLAAVAAVAALQAAASPAGAQPELEDSKRPRKPKTKAPTTKAPTTAAPTPAPKVGAAPVVVGAGPGFASAFTAKYAGHIIYASLVGGMVKMTPASGPTLDANATVLYTLPKGTVAAIDGSGILGITLNPGSFTKTGFLYLYVANRILASGAMRHQVLRITLTGFGTPKGPRYVAGSDKSLWTSNIAGYVDNGGALRFGPDGNLWFGVGDGAFDNDRGMGPYYAQNASVDLGKLIRITPAGGVPPTNPVKSSKHYAMGVRNVFGLAWDPETGKLWESEPGPQCTDELNVVPPGANLAWGPAWSCSAPQPGGVNADGAKRTLPVYWWQPANPSDPSSRPPTPTGLEFCTKCGVAELEGKLVVGFFNAKNLRALTLNATRTGVAAEEVVYSNIAPVVSVETDPAGAIFFSDAAGFIRRVVPLLG